jgi:septation ring formation regulator EzrA
MSDELDLFNASLDEIHDQLEKEGEKRKEIEGKIEELIDKISDIDTRKFLILSQMQHSNQIIRDSLELVILYRLVMDLDADYNEFRQLVIDEFENNDDLSKEVKEKFQKLEKQFNERKRPIEILKNFTLFNMGGVTGASIDTPSG